MHKDQFKCVISVRSTFQQNSWSQELIISLAGPFPSLLLRDANHRKSTEKASTVYACSVLFVCFVFFFVQAT